VRRFHLEIYKLDNYPLTFFRFKKKKKLGVGTSQELDKVDCGFQSNTLTAFFI